MNEPPKILVLCPDVPFPMRAGGQMRMASLIEALAAFSKVKVSFIAREIPEATFSWARDRNIALDPFDPPPMKTSQLWRERLATLLTLSNLRYRPLEKAFFDQTYLNYGPNLVWLETPYLLRYTMSWNREIPLVVDYWGTSEGAKRIFDNTSGVNKIWNWLHWRAARGGEIRYASGLQNIVTVSSKDANFFQHLAPHSRIFAIPNGILTKSMPVPGSEINQDSKSMIFTGDMSYTPNVDAMIWFTSEIFPIIVKQVPEAKLLIVGRNPAPVIEELAQEKNIVVKGYVADLAEAIAASAFYILPMRLGSGIRSKLFDVFPLEKAIVTTTIGAEGLELYHDENCVFADSVQDFAAACTRILRDEKERYRLGKAAGKLAFDIYSQKNVNKLVHRTVTEILTRRDG